MHTFSTKNLSDTKTEISAELSADDLSAAYDKVFRALKKDLEIKGFRRGAAPDNLVKEAVGEHTILFRAGEEAIQEAYSKIITESGIEAIGKPEITITKLALGNPLSFTIRTETLPELSLPDYKKLAREIAKPTPAPDPKEEDIDKALGSIRQSIHPKEGQPLSDEELVRLLGLPSMEELRGEIRKNISVAEEHSLKEKYRLAILEKILTHMTFSVPAILIEEESKKRLGELKERLEHEGVAFSDYLSHIKKTEEELLLGWKEPVEKKIRMHLLLRAIVKKEGITPHLEEVAVKKAEIIQNQPNIDPERLTRYLEELSEYEQAYKLLEQ